MPIISRDSSIVPACDVDLAYFSELVRATHALPQIGAYKIGFVLGLGAGLPAACAAARELTTKPLIYDHQKAGTDIPDTGAAFMRVCKRAGIDAVILFPQAGPVTETAWIKAAQDEGLGVIVGGLMTHKGYNVSDGGWITDEAVINIYLVAAKEGVREFVVPGTKLEAIAKIREMLVREGIDPIFHAPGLGAQGGSIAAAREAAGGHLHAIVGRALYDAADMSTAARELCETL